MSPYRSPAVPLSLRSFEHLVEPPRRTFRERVWPGIVVVMIALAAAAIGLAVHHRASVTPRPRAERARSVDPHRTPSARGAPDELDDATIESVLGVRLPKRPQPPPLHYSSVQGNH